MIVAQTNGGNGRTWTSIENVLGHSDSHTAHIAVAWIFFGAWTVFDQTVRDLLERNVRVVVHLGENLHLQHTPRNVIEGLMSLNEEFEGQFEAFWWKRPPLSSTPKRIGCCMSMASFSTGTSDQRTSRGLLWALEVRVLHETTRRGW